jgi:cellulose 1,4-beta-cellobiosidase
MYITYLVPSMAGSDLTLSWSAASGATSYRVYRGTTPNLLSLYTTVAAPNTTFTDTDAGTDGVNYYYRVTAVR